jgi:hypothetical protein
MNISFSSSAVSALLFWQERQQCSAGATERARGLPKKSKPLRHLFEFRERVLHRLIRECDAFEQQRAQPVSKDIAMLIALRMALFCESDASRVLRALSWTEDRDVLPGRVFRFVLLPATGTKPERLAINTLLLGDDEFARFRPLWSTDLSQLAKPSDLAQAGVELVKLLGTDAVDEAFASMLVVLAQSTLFRTSTLDACAAAGLAVESDAAPLVCLNLLTSRAPFDASVVPVAAFKKTVRRQPRLLCQNAD